MKVLVACEFSGRVRDAFTKLGHDAWSCDILPSISKGQHIQKDVTEILKQEWDLVIAHPPCTYLSKIGAGHRSIDLGRTMKMYEAVEFFKCCLNANAPKVVVENPIMYVDARKMIGIDPTQKVCPSEYGDKNTKATYLWIKGLPNLVPTHPKRKLVKGELDSTSAMSGTNLRLRRSITSQYLANAMANQWGGENA